MTMSAFEVYDTKKENQTLLIGKKYYFRSVDFADWFVEWRRYSKFVPKPF